MARHDLEFQLHYSILLEEMQMTLMGRVDRVCTFVQLFLGGATVGNLLPATATGLLVALLAGIQIVWQPSARAMEAKIHRDRYLDIRRHLTSLSDEDIDLALVNAKTNDSAVLGSLMHPAWLATAQAMGLPIPDKTPKMTLLESWLSFMAGNRPRYC